MPRLLIVGAMAAGMSAASKVRRLSPEWEVTALDAGEDVSYGACGLPYWLGGVTPSGSDLYALTTEQIAERGVEVLLRTRVTGLLEGRKRVEAEDLRNGRTREEAYDALLIATGARAVLPDLRGLDAENCFSLHDFGDGRRLHRFLEEERPRSAAIWGMGYIGLEMAENFRARGLTVTMVNRSSQILGGVAEPIRDRILDTLTDHGVAVRLQSEVREAMRSGDRITALDTDRGTVNADLFLVATGVRPATDFLRGSPLRIDGSGALRPDETCATGVHGIWAAGDCCAVRNRITGQWAYVPLGTTANKMGRVAGSNIAGVRERFPGIVATAIMKAFDLEVGITGLSAEDAAAAGFDPVTVDVEASTRAEYYPGGGTASVHLVADGRGRLLGGQICAPEGTKGRIDTLAAALTASMTADELASLDLAYAPPFAPVWDPLLVAANVLRSKLKNR